MSAKKMKDRQYIDDPKQTDNAINSIPARRRRGSMIALERRKKILSILSQRRKVTYAELVNECGVSQRTIQTDIEELILLYPIETVRGHGGGIKMKDGYYPDSIKMTAEQTALCRRLAEQLAGRFDFCGIKDLTPYQAVKHIVFSERYFVKGDLIVSLHFMRSDVLYWA